MNTILAGTGRLAVQLLVEGGCIPLCILRFSCLFSMRSMSTSSQGKKRYVFMIYRLDDNCRFDLLLLCLQADLYVGDMGIRVIEIALNVSFPLLSI